MAHQGGGSLVDWRPQWGCHGKVNASESPHSRLPQVMYSAVYIWLGRRLNLIHVVNHAWVHLQFCGKFLNISPKLQKNISYFQSLDQRRKWQRASSPTQKALSILISSLGFLCDLLLRICDPKKQTSLFGNGTQFTHSHVPPNNFKDIFLFIMNP